jgi:hypothetical protein
VLAGRRVEVVFAVYLAGRGAPVRAGMLDTGICLADVGHEPDPLQLSKLV